MTLPGASGEFTVLRNHAPIISALVRGNVKYVEKGGEEKSLSVEGGFVEVEKEQGDGLRRVAARFMAIVGKSDERFGTQIRKAVRHRGDDPHAGGRMGRRRADPVGFSGALPERLSVHSVGFSAVGAAVHYAAGPQPGERKRFIWLYMGMKVAKLLLAIVAIGVYTLGVGVQNTDFVLTLMGYYLIYLIYETVLFGKYGKKPETGRENDD